MAAIAAALVAAVPGHGQEEEQAARLLADRHAPVVVVRDLDDLCDRDGEAFRPAPVETVLGRPEIRLLDDDRREVMRGPAAADLAGRGPGWSLDFPGSPRRPGCRYARDFARLGAGAPAVAYAHLGRDPSAPGRLALQYWLFWYFDDFVNTHEGDWEFVQLVFDAATAEEALGEAPAEVGYSQHSGGERSDWDDPKLEREGARPVVYAAAGSHANFFSSDVHLGRSADEGFGCDVTTEPSTRLATEARLLPDAGPDASGPLAWMLFEGRWGEFQPTPYDAPPGPFTKGEWRTPIAWQESLRDSSFSIPSGGALGPTATGAFCDVVRLGGRIYTRVTSPTLLLLIVLGLVASGGAAVRATRWSPPVPHPLRRRRADGQVLRAAARAYRGNRRLLLALGAVFLPAAAIESAATGAVLALTPAGSLVDVAGRGSLVSALVGLLVGGAGHLVSAAIVFGGVAAVLDAGDRDRTPGVRNAYRMLGARLGGLLGTVGLATLATLALGVTVVGIPLAIVLLGRWAVATQASAIERLGPRAALARSRALTHGRWWRAARLSVLVNAIGLASGPIVGIVLLLTSPLPLATINAVSSAVFVVTMPFVGAALAMLYGDLVSRERGGPGESA